MTEEHHHLIDPDIDLTDPAQLAEVRPREWDLLLVIAVGGVLGAEARYGLSRWFTHRVGTMPWSTVVINVVGSMLIGVLIAIVEAGTYHRLLRPFVGVGILGGFTTFSTFAVDVDSLIHAHRAGVALGYLMITAVSCVAAVVLGDRIGQRIERVTA